MVKTLTSPVSIEKFAAYLDGNLSLEETQDMAELIMNDSSLSNILNVNIIIDDQIHKMLEAGFELPNDLASSDFSFPKLDDLTGLLNLEESGTIVHEDNSLVTNDGCDDSNNENSFHQDFANLNENTNFEGYPSIDNDSMNGLESYLDFLNDD